MLTRGGDYNTRGICNDYYVCTFLPGTLSPPVVSYDVSVDRRSVDFSWIAPFTLDISDVEPDILYYLVYIISDTNSTTLKVNGVHYSLESDLCGSQVYRVEIAAVNIVGEGGKYYSPPLVLGRKGKLYVN